MKLAKLLFALLIALGGVSFLGCEEEGTLENAGENADDALRDAEDAADDAADDIGDAADDAADDLDN